MSGKNASLTLIILVVLFILFLGGWSKRQEGQSPQIEAPPYALRGPYEVGLQAHTIEGENSLELTVWYPTAAASSEMQYEYPVKMSDPPGDVTLATFSGRAARDAAYNLAGGPYPVVILSPGFSVGSLAYAWLGEHLASYGFVVISPEHVEHLDPEGQLWRSAITRPQDILAVFAYLDAQTAPGGRFEGLVDVERAAVVGHSYGGYTALAAAGAAIHTQAFESHCTDAMAEAHEAAWLCEMLLPHLAGMAELAGLDRVPDDAWPAAADPRVDAVVSIAGDAFFFGPEGLAEIRIPVMAIGGTADMDSPYAWSTQPAYEYSAGPRKVEVTLEGAEHMIFTAVCEHTRWYLKFISGEFCKDSTWNRGDAHALTRHFVTAFLLAELAGDSQAALALWPEAVDIAEVGYRAEGYAENAFTRVEGTR